MRQRDFNSFLNILLGVLVINILLNLLLGDALTDKDETYVVTGAIKSSVYLQGKSSMGVVSLEVDNGELQELVTFDRKLVEFLQTRLGHEYQFKYYISYTYSIFSPQMRVVNYQPMEDK